MIAFALVALFAISGCAALIVLADGFVRGRNAWRTLQQDLVRLDSVRAITVRFDGEVSMRQGRAPIPALRSTGGNSSRRQRATARVAIPRQRAAA